MGVGQGERTDPELNEWLAKRHGLATAPRAKSAARRASSQERFLPPDAVRAGDSPRTASWRAAVAQTSGRALSKERQRSSSPSLEHWLAKRSEVKKGAERHTARRASSMPPARGSEANKAAESFQVEDIAPIPWDPERNEDRKAWAEVQDEDQAEEDGLFQEMEDRRRQMQAEQSSVTG